MGRAPALFPKSQAYCCEAESQHQETRMRQKAKPLQLKSIKLNHRKSLFTHIDTSIQYPYPIRAWDCVTDNVHIGLRFSRSLSLGF
jgi:hypothetical protein